MLFGKQKKIKRCETAENDLNFTMIYNPYNDKYELLIHQNFETNTYFRGTEEEVNNKFNSLVEIYNMTVINY
jgi:hypothetical protein